MFLVQDGCLWRELLSLPVGDRAGELSGNLPVDMLNATSFGQPTGNL